jgi:hypothetical protein
MATKADRRKSETDLSRYDWSKAVRGRHAERARRSLAFLTLDKKTVDTLGGPEAVSELLTVLAKAVQGTHKKRAA